MVLNSGNTISYGQTSEKVPLVPTVYDSGLRIELVEDGFNFPTTMEFLGPDDFLILEKDTGLVKRVINGKTLETPLLQIEVSKKDERGLLGVAISERKTPDPADGTQLNNNDITRYVFLYAVQCEGKGKSENCENRIYRYELDNKNNLLINPKMLLAIPSFPESSHVGGIVKVGPDGNLYLTVGNFQRTVPINLYESKSQNYETGHDFDGRGGILRITQDGEPVNEVILGNEYPLNLYYAYGIRNSFGMDFDPLTGKLWDTENGPYFADEINLVEPGFNSGAEKIFGIWHSDGMGNKLKLDESSKTYDIVEADKPSDLLYVGKGYYSPPKFIWDKTVAPTALVFYQFNSLGNQYENDIFVGSADGGRIFNFNLNDQRDGLLLNGPLSDKIANNKEEYQDILFADGFSYITDIKIDPGSGNMYIITGSKASKTEKFGEVYRIMPGEDNIMQENIAQQVDQAQQIDIGVSVLDALTKMAPKQAEKPKIDAKSITDFVTKPYKVSPQTLTDGRNDTTIASVDVKANNDSAKKMNSDQISKIVNESEIGDQIILKGILSSIPKDVQEGKKSKTYQTAVILPPREDGAIYSGILTLSSNKAIDLLSLNNYEINSNILANISLSENVPDSSSKSVIQQDEYIETTIASIEEKSGDKYDLSIPFLGNAIQIQNPENESFTAVFTVKADVLKAENINDSN
jgi:glucose/arabinose dehydrogenase